MAKINRATAVAGVQNVDKEPNWKRRTSLSDIALRYTLVIITGEASKGYKKKKSETKW